MLQVPKMLASFQDFVVFWAIENTGISRMLVLGAPQKAEMSHDVLASSASRCWNFQDLCACGALKDAEIFRLR